MRKLIILISILLIPILAYPWGESLLDPEDVDKTAPTDGDGLFWDDTLQRWYSENVTEVPVTNLYGRIWIPINGGTCSTTNGCIDSVQNETSTNKVNYWTAAFGNDADDYWSAIVVMPENYDGGTVTAIIVWTPDSDCTSGGVAWFVQGMSIADNDVIDTAYGTAVEIDDTWLAAGDLHISPESSAITISGSPAGGDLVAFHVYRDVDDTFDTLTGGSSNQSNMLGLVIIYSKDQLSSED